MDNYQLETTAQTLVLKGKGILAADEGPGTMQKRFKNIKIDSTEESRRFYREVLFSTPQIEDYISGVILHDETIRQAAQDGTPFPKLLERKGILSGIEVDRGPVDLAGHPGEKVTEGLDGLRTRLAEYRALGASFAKWRAVITIGPGIPTHCCLIANAEALAQYAAVCQEMALVPMVEPDVLLDGSHDLERCEQVTQAALSAVFSKLGEYGVFFEGILLKPNMILPGKECPKPAPVEEVAMSTVRCLRRTVPGAVPGIAFLSGGQSPEQATKHLNAINASGSHPWRQSFSYARALQEPVIAAWNGQAANVALAQKVFYHRAKCNGFASLGKYTEDMEKLL